MVEELFKKENLTFEEKRVIVEYYFNDLLSSSVRLKKPESIAKVKKAFEIADKAHIDQFRKTGQKLPFIVHPLSVAKIISTEMGFGSTTIAAALLHDTVEDTSITLEYLKEEFGDEVAKIVEGVTKITNVFNTESSEQAETFRHLIFRMSEDKRIAYVKIADRLHNMRTLEGIQENSQMIKSAEALNVYAPLAHQLGLYEIRKELEDLSFKYREPENYKKIKSIVDNSLGERAKMFLDLSEPLEKTLKKHHYEFDIVPVTKSYYKTWRIIEEQNVEFSEIHNFMSVRIVFEAKKLYSEKEQCYILYSRLTDLFATRETELRDWITNPKSNGFEALVTSIMLNGKWAEIQIMTKRMNQIAERGYAKDHENLHLKNIDRWIRSSGKALENVNLTSDEILNIVTPQAQEIRVFTPNGRIIVLPKGSTTLDFAFKIHTDIGTHFKAALVNKKMVGLDYILERADRVQIITDDVIKPNKKWLDILICPNNKDELKRYFRRERSSLINKGMQLYNKLEVENKAGDHALSQIISEFNCKNKDDLYYKIGNDFINVDMLKSKMLIVNKKSLFTRIFRFSSNNSDKTEISKNEISFNPKIPFTIYSLEDIIIADCCNPLEGDPSIVYFNKNSFTVHKKDCKKAMSLNATEGKKTAVVKWKLSGKEVFRAKIKLEGIDEAGLILSVTKIISNEMNINMISIFIKSEKNIFEGTIELLISNAKNLTNLIKEIQKLKNITRVKRIT